MKWLSENGCGFNTYTERGMKKKSFILRGIAHGNDDENRKLIGDALIVNSVTGDFSINRLMTGFMKRNPANAGQPIYRIIVNHDVNDATIAAITKIGFFSVRFEKMKRSRIIQCHRCQKQCVPTSIDAYNAFRTMDRAVARETQTRFYRLVA